jgi:autotransporter-associated beta strand protein
VGTTTNDQKYGGNLVKQGAGTAELSGVNGYSGSTTVNDGTLVLSGATTNTPLVSITGSSNAVLKLMMTNALSSIVNFTGAHASASTGVVDFNSVGNYTFNRYGESAGKPGLQMAFTNSSVSAVTATFTNETNYLTDPTDSSEGKVIHNQSANLTLILNGAMEIGSTASGSFGLNGVGDFILRGSVTNSGTGTRGLTKSGSGKASLNAVNSYNGATTVSDGTLEVGAAGALPVTSAVIVSNGATLRFNKSSGDISVGALTVTGNLEQNLVTIISSGAVDLTESTLTVNGKPTDLSYTLIEGTSLTGIPTLSTAIDGYELNVDSTSVKLVKTVVVTGSTFDTTYPVGSEEVVGPNGLKNLMNYALGGTALNPSPELPVLTIDENGLTLTANIRNDDSNLNLPEKVVGQWAISLEGPWTDVPLTPTGSASAVPNTTTKSFTQSVESSQPRKFLRFRVTK